MAKGAAVFESAMERMPAPADLSAPEAVVWADLVNALPADWFHVEHEHLMRAYVKHAVYGMELDRRIGLAFEEGDEKRAGDLLKLRKPQTDALVNVARQMRITHQARWQPKTAGDKTKAEKRAKGLPWAS